MNLIGLLLLLPVLGIGAVYASPVPVRRLVPAVVTVLNLLVMAAVLWVRYGVTETEPATSQWWLMDPLSLVVTCITLVVGFTASVYSIGYVREHTGGAPEKAPKERQYFALLLAFYASLIAVSIVQNMFFTWAAIELTALSSVLLVDWNDTKLTHEAAWKYLVIMVTAGLIALFGLVTVVGSANVPFTSADWSALVRLASHVPPTLLRIAFALVLVGFGAKAGLVPFNFWLPDAHSQAPSPVSAMLSGIKLNCAMYGILRLQGVLHAGGQTQFADAALGTLGFVTVGVSALMTVAQTDAKRLFAYSSAENLGLVAIGFAFGPIGAFAGYLQMANHSIIKSMLFYHSGELLHASGSTDMRGMRGIISVLPRTGRALMLGMIAIAGAPPFGLFISEFLVVFAIVRHGTPILAALLLAFLMILFASFLQRAVQIGYGAPSRRLLDYRGHAVQESAGVTVPTILHLAIALAFGTVLPFVLSSLPGVIMT
ncbi:proton-conducting transporter transmembrane domain-containing protein [Alicyclobacillus shizuokensis]|uniref:proton-conducting transporter transmembrane domain-containing protein n=1 Tax=Alicyclobacillus shizuokensis TaxID=392014 RepID=UPI00082F8D26|nr:proton-conducting transporter membrane subunit [Alicyclobacillus shizuokensis]